MWELEMERTTNATFGLLVMASKDVLCPWKERQGHGEERPFQIQWTPVDGRDPPPLPLHVDGDRHPPCALVPHRRHLPGPVPSIE